MEDLESYAPSRSLMADAYIGSNEVFADKLHYLARIAQPEQWDYTSTEAYPNKILKNYLFYTYDRLKQEGKIAVSTDCDAMCFNTGLQTINGNDIFAYFEKNTNRNARPGQVWFLKSFRQQTETDLRKFPNLPDIADYFTDPADFIFDKNFEISIDYDHIIDDNFERFESIGISEKFIADALLRSAIGKIVERVKRNYKLAIPQFYTERGTGNSKIQLLLPLFLKNTTNADLALVVDKAQYQYVGKTILHIEWAYINSRRIVKPDVDWLKF